MADTADQAPPAEDVVQVTADAPVAQNDTSVADANDDEDIKSKKVTLADLSAKGTALYAHKSYEEAAEVFSRASILQAEINGETAPENAEILFHYGRSLFRVGQSKSDVLGGSAPAPEKEKKKSSSKANGGAEALAKPLAAQTIEEEVTQEGVAIAAAEKGSEQKKGDGEEKDAVANKPLFQFTGDENFDDSDDEQDEVRALAFAFQVVCFRGETILTNIIGSRRG